MPAPQITALPDPPSRQDPTNFAVKGDAFLGGLPAFATEANALATQVNERVDAAFAAGLESAATNAATTVTKAAEARASELAAAGYANEAMLLSLGVETLRPAIKPTLMFDFVNSQVVPPQITFTRTTSGSRVAPSGLIETVGINEARIDYDPITRACRGLLMEEQRANLYLRSEEFDNASWAKSLSTITANGAIAPDGTLTADLTIPNSGATTSNPSSSNGGVSQAITVVAATQYCFSVYAKAGAFTVVQLRKAQENIQVTFDLASGVITSGAGNAAFNAFIIPAGNGWYRIGASGSVAGTTFTVNIKAGTTGDGVSGVYIWGAQFEEGQRPTSYIKTEASAVTRATDNAAVLSVSPWLRADEGTLYAEALTGIDLDDGANRRVFSLNDNSMNNVVNAIRASSGGSDRRAQSSVTTGGVSQASISSADDIFSASVVHKMAVGFKQNDIIFMFDGAVVGTDTSASVPTGLSRLTIGAVHNNTSTFNGYIRQLRFYPQRLPNAQIQALTTL